MLKIEAILVMYEAEEGGLDGALNLPSLALLLHPAATDFRERAGQDYFGIRINKADGKLAPGAELITELSFLADEARPWIEVDSEFHLDIPPRRVGRGHVIQLLEDPAGPS